MVKSKIPLRVGDILKIDLEENYCCFGRVLSEPLIAFYDKKTSKVPVIQDIISLPVLFRIWVMNYAVASGRWKVIGNCSLEPHLKITPKFFKQDPITKKLFIYAAGKEIPATFEECKLLERAAVWDPEHVEDRLRDHFAGISNKWVESMRPKK